MCVYLYICIYIIYIYTHIHVNICIYIFTALSPPRSAACMTYWNYIVEFEKICMMLPQILSRVIKED